MTQKLDQTKELAFPAPTARYWHNWSGSVRFQPSAYLKPSSMPELQAQVRDAALAGRTVRVVGSGHSFVPLVETQGALLSLDHLSGIEQIEGDEATLMAGTRLKPLGEELAERGYGMMNLGDINKQAIAGAVATGTHGTGLTLGCISSQVQGMTLVLPDGELFNCSEHHHPDVFAAARVSLGTLGVIAKLRIKLNKAYKLKLVKQAMALDECLSRATELARKHRHFEFYWIPHSQQTLVKMMDPTDEPESNTALTSFLELVLENGVFGGISRLARFNPQWAPALAGVIASATKGDQSTMVADCHRAFSTIRLVRFHEMEYELPAERGPDALRELAEFVARKRILVHFPVEFRYVAADDIWLSPFYQRESVAISVHQYVGMDYRDYFAGAEAIFRNHGGRPHWGKMHHLRAKDFAQMYPRWDDFLAVRERLDPRGVFLNPYMHQLLGV